MNGFKISGMPRFLFRHFFKKIHTLNNQQSIMNVYSMDEINEFIESETNYTITKRNMVEILKFLENVNGALTKEKILLVTDLWWALNVSNDYNSICRALFNCTKMSFTENMSFNVMFSGMKDNEIIVIMHQENFKHISKNFLLDHKYLGSYTKSETTYARCDIIDFGENNVFEKKVNISFLNNTIKLTIGKKEYNFGDV